jgi:glycosyltransferase involved in cell wall biosynthesis
MDARTTPVSTILYEVQDLTKGMGTGIATYARNLVAASGRLGFEAQALIGVEPALPTQDEKLNELLAFDAASRARAQAPRSRRALEYWRGVLGGLGGFAPFEVKRSGMVVGPVVDALAPFSRVFAATRLFDVAITHFDMYRRFLPIRLEGRPRLFHATRAVPIVVPKVPNIYTIHDIIPLRLPFATTTSKRRYWRTMKTIVQRADHIVTVSEHSRRDLIQHLGADEARVTNTYQPVDLATELEGLDDEEMARLLAHAYGLEPREYFLFCGAIEPKKNLSRTLQAYAESGVHRPLIIAGSDGWLNDDELRRIGDRRFVTLRMTGAGIRRERRVRRVRYLPRRHLVALMKGARALIFPSLYEGFGLPVLEAMTLGTPVITSNTTSLPEVAGDAAVLVDPYSTESLRRALQTMDIDADLRGELARRGPTQAKKFSAEAYDERLRRLYDSF